MFLELFRRNYVIFGNLKFVEVNKLLVCFYYLLL